MEYKFSQFPLLIRCENLRVHAFPFIVMNINMDPTIYACMRSMHQK